MYCVNDMVIMCEQLFVYFVVKVVVYSCNELGMGYNMFFWLNGNWVIIVFVVKVGDKWFNVVCFDGKKL